MEASRRDYFLNFTRIGMALGAMMLLKMPMLWCYVSISSFLMNQEAGVFRWLSWLFHSDWTGLLTEHVLIFGTLYLVVYLIVRSMPKTKGPQRRLAFGEFILCLVLALGIGTLLNIGGNLVNAFFTLFNHKTVDEMNPIVEALENPTIDMLLYACLLGPVMEELVFRGFLLKRARRFGDRTAVVFCSVAFGLMHGNLVQCLYAVFIGLILGYIVAKTNRLRYSILLHIAFNSYSAVIQEGWLFWENRGYEIMEILYLLAVFAVELLFMVSAVILLWKNGGRAGRELALANKGPSRYKKYAYLNPGFILFAGTCAVEMLAYLL
ncbi:MAG: CPBP family intramembrane metalloprotease [Lachnospiraceae bacterium]|nr:CPBP family intramembrane metalloprotease [Lachnospiraceae bacterium]